VIQRSRLLLPHALAAALGVAIGPSVAIAQEGIVLRTTAREVAKRRTYERRTDLVLVDEREDGKASPERTLLDQEALRHFYSALSKLSLKRRNAFVLCAIERLSHEEAASIEEVTIDALRARLKHARADLEQLVREDPLLTPYLGDAS